MGFNFSTQDQKFFASLVQEQINLYGLDLEYWVVEFDQTKDKLYAEDTSPVIKQKYNIKGYTSVIINELFNFNKFGSFQSPDVIELFISAKEYEERVGENEKPKVGDYLYIEYTKRVWQISGIHHEDTLFLQKEYTYKLILNSANNIGGTIDPESDTLAISDWTSGGVDLDDNDFLEEEVSKVVVEKSGDIDPFGAWG